MAILSMWTVSPSIMCPVTITSMPRSLSMFTASWLWIFRTFLDLPSTKTSDAPFSLTHCAVQVLPAAVTAFLAPQALSLMYPVHVIVFSSAAAMTPAIVSTIASKPMRLIAFRMYVLLHFDFPRPSPAGFVHPERFFWVPETFLALQHESSEVSRSQGQLRMPQAIG